MGRRPTYDDDGFDSPGKRSTLNSEEAHNLLRSINRSFHQVNLATEFFLLEDETNHTGQTLQLACLIRDRISRIEEQVSELYRVLNQPPQHGRHPHRHPAPLQ